MISHQCTAYCQAKLRCIARASREYITMACKHWTRGRTWWSGLDLSWWFHEGIGEVGRLRFSGSLGESARKIASLVSSSSKIRIEGWTETAFITAATSNQLAISIIVCRLRMGQGNCEKEADDDLQKCINIRANKVYPNFFKYKRKAKK